MLSDARSGPRDTPDDDPAALPPELAEQSLSHAALILPSDAAIRAIKHFAARGRRLENWEGWVKLPDGGRTKSLSHGGSFALPRDTTRAAETAITGIQRAQATWDRSPEYPGAALYFGLTFSAE